jgi:NAD+ diphosphatase
MSDPQWWLLDDLVLARSGIDRAAERRQDVAWVQAARVDPRSRFVRVHDGHAVLHGDRIDLTGPPNEAVPTSLLGIDSDDVAYFCAHYDVRPQIAEYLRWADLRMSGSGLNATDAGLMVASVALDNWSRNHRRCPRCGGELVWRDAGWARFCEHDNVSHFPRTDPAVIVLVRDADDRALLGRQVRWEPHWFSTLAGFVEAGESAEAAVRREVEEESGVRIGSRPDDVQYLGSQPWPFPASLMLGYHAFADDPAINVDGEEIAEARWFSRDDMAKACESGEVSLPPAVSIARKLIERWYGSPLPGDWSRPFTRPSR